MGTNKRRREYRVKAIGVQVEESIRQDAEDKKLKHVEAKHLFQVDNTGGAPLTRAQKLEKLQKNSLLASTRKFDASKFQKIQARLNKKLKTQSIKLQKPKKSGRVQNLWGQDGSVKDDEIKQNLDEYVAPVVIKKTKHRKLLASTKYKVPVVEVAAPGQSYHPSFESHQDIMAEAVANELERQDRKAQQQDPLSKGMSEETLQFIAQNSSDSEDDSNESNDENNTSARRCKVSEKVTRAQRNKRSRHKKLELEHQIRRGQKAIIKQINASNHILQDIIHSEKEAAKKKELKKLQQEQKLTAEPLVRVAGKYIKLERETPVTLSSELTGNLRTINPKGHPLLERFDSMHKRNKIEIGRPKKRRKAKVKIIETRKDS